MTLLSAQVCMDVYAVIHLSRKPLSLIVSHEAKKFKCAVLSGGSSVHQCNGLAPGGHS